MRRLLYIPLLLAAILHFSCRSTDYSTPADSSCSFNVAVASYDGESTKAALQPITALKAAIYDDQGRLVQQHVAINYSSNLAKIDVEGLRDGKYTAAFFAIGELRHEVTLTPPQTLHEPWIPQSPVANGDYNEYLATKIPFEILHGASQTQQAMLQHVVSKISINVDLSYPNWAGGPVQSFILDFDEATFATNQTVNGEYTGFNKQSFDLGATLRDIYLLPASSTGKIRGRAILIGAYADGRECRAEKEFALTIEPNKRSTVHLTFEPVEQDNLGLIRFYDADRKLHRSRKVWQDGCDKSEYLGGQAFYPTKPIALALDAAKKELKVTFYGGLTLKDVTVLIKRPRDLEFFEVAWFESIEPFEERKIDFSANVGPKLYRTETGNLAMFDGVKSLNGVEVKYKSEETFIKKIQTITWPGYLTFNAGEGRVVWCEPGSAFPPPATQSLIVRPVYVREAMALMTNAGYILSSQGWQERMLQSEAEGPFYNDEAQNPISFQNTILPKMMKAENLNLSIINPNHDYRLHGVANVGNGAYFSLREFVLIEHYTSWDRCNTFYHEFMHTAGYGHGGNLTYGKFCDQTPQYHVSKINELPYYSSSILHSWDNPTRFR